jgi:hypothetical protein
MTLKIKKQGGEQGGVVESGCPGFFKIWLLPSLRKVIEIEKVKKEEIS